jgi:protein required for attachment to host cells
MSFGSSGKQKLFWVVVADESKAIVYTRQTKHGSLHKSFSKVNETARQKTASLISDRGGRSFDRRGTGRHTLANEKDDPKRHIAVAFAKNIAKRIAVAMHSGDCREFILIAPPTFLGILRGALAVAGNVVPVLTINKEAIGREADFVQKLIADELELK